MRYLTHNQRTALILRATIIASVLMAIAIALIIPEAGPGL